MLKWHPHLWFLKPNVCRSVWALFGSRLCELWFIKLCSCLLQKTMCAMRVEYSQIISPRRYPKNWPIVTGEVTPWRPLPQYTFWLCTVASFPGLPHFFCSSVCFQYKLKNKNGEAWERGYAYSMHMDTFYYVNHVLVSAVSLLITTTTVSYHSGTQLFYLSQHTHLLSMLNGKGFIHGNVICLWFFTLSPSLLTSRYNCISPPSRCIS